MKQRATLNHISHRRTLLFIAVLFLAGCNEATIHEPPGARTEEIIIISTNDIHGAIDNMPSLATLVDNYRALSPYVLLVDAGDKWTGNPYVDFHNPPYTPMVELMNDVRYDISTLGNHEFDKGLSILSNHVRSFNFVTVLANIKSGSTPLSQPHPYITTTVGGIKLCFLGLLDNSRDGYPDGNKENFGSAVFSNHLAIAKSYKHLREQSDVFIGLTHIGAEADSILALQMPQFDMIIGGHSHTAMPHGRMINGVLVTQTGKNLKYAGITRLRFCDGELISRDNSLVALDKVTPNQRLHQKVQQYKKNPELERPIGSFDKEMDKVALLNFISDAMRDNIPCDFALYNKEGVRIDSHKGGDFTVFDLFAMDPFGGMACEIQLTLNDIKDLILLKFNTAGGEGHTADLFPSGMCYTIETDGNGNGINVIFYDQNWNELTGTKSYNVVTSDYVNENYNFPKQGSGVTTSLLTTDLMVSYLEKHSPVKVSSAHRIKIIKTNK